MTMAARTDYSNLVHAAPDGRNALQLAVGGMNCAGCAFKIERALNAVPDVEARVNVTEKRLSLLWQGPVDDGNALLAKVRDLGFDLSPVSQAEKQTGASLRHLLRCVAVAGFAAGNIMIFSLVLWFSDHASIGDGMRDTFHWFSALLAMPAVAYAGQPFFSSAWKALRQGRTNMDVPISVALFLSCAVSLYETLTHGAYVYFDSAAMLLFFLLVGRYLDARARFYTRHAASDLLALMQGEAMVAGAGGRLDRKPAGALRPGDRIMVAKGEKILADGRAAAAMQVDASILTGESLPRRIEAGAEVYAGMINTGDAAYVDVEKTQSGSAMADIIALMQKAEQGNARYVRLADRIARWYTPVVHALALTTFIGWWQWGGIDWQQAMMYGATVLIITCPCALALAVPVSQVVASSLLFRKGLLVRNADALERFSTVDTVIFDKTGTLTTGRLQLEEGQDIAPATAALLAAVAAHSSHPVAKSLAAALGAAAPLQAENITETAGEGMAADVAGQHVRLGSAASFQAADDGDDIALWYKIGADPARRLSFRDTLYDDAQAAVRRLAGRYRLVLLSGDRYAVTRKVAGDLDIAVFYAAVDPRRKYEIVEQEIARGHRVLMVGDGINDAAALSLATASLSPGTASAIAQNAADIVYQREGVMPVVDALTTAARLQRVVRQNFGLALMYNVLAIPLAMAGFVTPLVAAVAMSSSSLLVIGNALRLRKAGRA